MKALCTNLIIIVLLVALTPACTPESGGGGLFDGIFNFGDDGQQVDPLIEATAGANAVAIADVNNDGHVDFVSISSENQPVQLHLLNSQGQFDLLSIAGGGPLAIMNDVVTADFNLDGRMDVAVLANDTGYVPPEGASKPASLILLIQGADALDPSDWTKVQPGWDCYVDPMQAHCGLFYAANATGPTDVAVGDFNNDGRPDLAVASNEYRADSDVPNTFVYVYLNPGAANATNPGAWTRIIADSDVNDYTSIAVVDLDSDGDDDIVAAAPVTKTHNIRWLRNGGNGTTWDEIMVGQQSGGGNRIAVADINNDGSPDVVAADSTHSLIQWFRNPGPSALAPTAAEVPWYVYNIGLISDISVDGDTQSITFDQVQALDTDGDGEIEIFATGSGIAYEFQRTSNIFNPWTGTALFKADPSGTLGRCGFYDYSGNGRLDIVVPVDRDGLTQDGFYLFAR